MSRVHLIHGAFNKNASGWDQLFDELALAEYRPLTRHYGWVGPITTEARSREAGERLAEDVRPGDHVIAFSNGGLVCWHALEVGMECDRVVLIMPALQRDATFGAGANKIIVLHNSGDWAVEASRIWSWLNPFGWASGWGAMGRKGPATGDVRVEAIDTEAEHGTRGHLAWRDDDADYWMPRIAQLLEGP